MIILTKQSSGTHIARVYTEELVYTRYTASCTESDAGAARHVIRKFYGEKHVERLEEVPDPEAFKIAMTIFKNSRKMHHIPPKIWRF